MPLSSRSKLKFFLVFAISIILLASTAQSGINKGIWYHQQPTSDVDSGPFYGGSSTYEGWCGPASMAMGLHYFIPNIHAKLYGIYGEADYHSDGRGGLKNNDPYIYSPSRTYTFEDFLGHNYIGRHVTTSGCSYYELKSIITGVDADLNSYSADVAWVSLSQMRDYLDNGWLAIVNTYQGGGHYILIVGWEGSLTDPDQRYYYIWDPWKVPLGLSSSEYTTTTELVGNKPNYGTALNISAYKITATTLNNIFRDQLGDGTVLAFRFTPVDLPASVTEVSAKAVWAWGSTVRSEGASNFVNTVAAHGISDIFLLVKGIDGTFTTTTLEEVIPLAHQQGIRVHAWTIVLNDMAASESGNYAGVGGSWIDARDTAYRNYFINDVIVPLCALDIDGIHLDCIRYPGNANSYPGAQDAITEYCRQSREAMDNNGKSTIPLSAAIMPEGDDTAVFYGQDVSVMSQYLKFITPMTYTHNYLASPSWLGSQTAYFVGKVVAGCEVWAGIQSSDDDGNYMTCLELKQCVDYGVANGATGIAYFRYPLTDWQWEQSDQWLVSSSPTIRGAITEAVTDQSQYYQGDSVIVKIVVKNTGNVDLDNSVVEWNINDPAGTVQASYSKTIAVLTPGESDTVSDVYALAADAQIGTWQVDYAFKTSDGNILDSSSLNGHSPINFEVVEPPSNNSGKILSVTTNADYYYPAEKVEASAKVINDGVASLINAVVKFEYISPSESVITTGLVTISNLNAGDSTVVSDTSLTLSSVPLDVSGNWTIIVTFSTETSVTLDSDSSGTFTVYRTVSHAQYMDMAVRCANWMDENYNYGYHTYPNYVSVGDGRTVSLAQMYHIMGEVLQEYFLNQTFPNYVRVRNISGQPSAGDANSWMWKNIGRSDDGGATFYDVSYLWTSSYYGPEYRHYVELDDFLDACDRSANFVENNIQVPNYVRVWNDYYSAYWNSVPACQFLYMMTRTLRYYDVNDVMPNIVSIIDMYVPRSTAEWEQYSDTGDGVYKPASFSDESRQNGKDSEKSKPKHFYLYQNYPNPFNPDTYISYQLPENSHVIIRIFNLLGHEVRTLVKEEKPAGHFSVHWDGKDNNSKQVGSGIYLYQIKTEKYTCTKKMSFLK